MRQVLKKQGNNVMIRVLLMFLIMGFCWNGWAQEKEPVLAKAEKKEVVEKIGKLLDANYVFPDMGKKMGAFLAKKLKKGKYKKITSPTKFARQLTEDLREVSKDKHMGVRYSPHVVTLIRNRKDDDSIPKEFLERTRLVHYGFNELKILAVNIGYLDLRMFADPNYAGKTAAAAMNFFAGCDALIIDLRRNGGGSPGMIQLISSYLFSGKERVHLNNFYWRPEDKNTQTWTLPHVPGQRMPDIPVYVLTSGRTFSAAEEFSYNLKHLKRATLVGEVTGGGAHPVDRKIVNDNFLLTVATGRAINPNTKTNWEGVGVKPHIEVPRDKALDTAYLDVLEKLYAKCKVEQLKTHYKWAMDAVKAKLTPVTIDEETLKSYAGKYGERTLTFENGVLFYQRVNNPKVKLIPITETIFKMNEIDFFRLEIIKENGKVTALKGLYDNGRSDLDKKEK